MAATIPKARQPSAALQRFIWSPNAHFPFGHFPPILMCALTYNWNLMSNRLAKETSPYLLQHAENPVDWYPWGEEATSLARLRNKPILLSIGYSACHWCHVMEKETFQNEIIAKQMNTNFISIKVDFPVACLGITISLWTSATVNIFAFTKYSVNVLKSFFLN